MWYIKIKSLLTGQWVMSHLDIYSTKRRAENAAKKEFDERLRSSGYEWKVCSL